MKIKPNINTNDVSSCQEWFVKLKIEDNLVEPLENQLQCLNLSDDDNDTGELIERTPIRSKDIKARIKPYKETQHINRYVSYPLSCGGTYIDTQQKQQTCLCEYSYPSCHSLDCDACTLQLANSPEFKEYCTNQYNLTERDDNLEEIKQNHLPPPRRISHDSGFQSDNPSPLSDSVLSPKSKPEVVTKVYRKILPKMPETNALKNGINVIGRIRDLETEPAKEALRAKLNSAVKVKEWVEVMMKKTDEEVFGVDGNGQTILHRLLESNRKHMAEAFYPLVEKMKLTPAKCTHIITAQSSICDAIKPKYTDLLLDYFHEALQIIQDKTNVLKK